MSLEIALCILAGILVWTLGGTVCVIRQVRRSDDASTRMYAEHEVGRKLLLSCGILFGPLFILIETLHIAIEVATTVGTVGSKCISTVMFFVPRHYNGDLK